MAEQPHIPEQDQPVIPPHYMLLLALAGFVVALGVFFTQPTFTVVGWGGLGIAVLSLAAWVLMAPDQAKAALTGRTVRFGGTSLVVTVVVLAALVAVYTLVRGQSWRLDLTQRDTFSLTSESRQAISVMSADPTVPAIKMIAFYDSTQAARRDQDILLFEDYVRTSGGKISYEFVDPDQNPALAQQMNITRGGQIFVAALDENGQPDIENGEVVNFFSQDGLTNAVLKVAAAGDFWAYFVTVPGGLRLTTSTPDGMNTINDLLTQRLDWNTREVGLFEFSAPVGGVRLNDPNLDGEVVVIPGGDTPLTAEELKVLTDYLDAGGQLIILAGPSSKPDTTSLATDPALNEYLWANFGLRFQDNIVIDPVLAWQTPLIPVATDFSVSHPITSSFPRRSGMAFEIPHSIEIANPLPQGVDGRYLARSSADAYAKTDYQAVINGQIDRAPDDAAGPFPLAAVAENTTTGARVVLFGSTSIFANGYAPIASLVNLDTALNSLIWTTGFDEFFTQINIQSAQRPQDTPIFVDRQSAGTINFVTTILLPFGTLLIGFLVWWNSREPAR
jgi:hypothetical protein